MATYKRESHIRSILKGISWRVVATTDTILLVLLITCLSGHCSAENALKIGAAEFLIKLIIYYVHERGWQRYLTYKEVTAKVTLYKTIVWRLIATSATFVISGTILNSFDGIALSIALLESITKFILYYFHERLWLRIPLGRIRNYVRNLIKK